MIWDPCPIFQIQHPSKGLVLMYCWGGSWKEGIVMVHIKVPGDDRTTFGRTLREEQKYSER